MSKLNADAVETALRELIADLDYDVHKYIERDETTGENTYPDKVEQFIAVYEAATSEEGEAPAS